VRGQQQPVVVLGEAQQAHPQQRATGQVEPRALLVTDALRRGRHSPVGR
jgi:hypothetical protein